VTGAGTVIYVPTWYEWGNWSCYTCEHEFRYMYLFEIMGM